MKICISVGPGGHLDETNQIIDAFKDEETFFVTAFSEVSSELKNENEVYYLKKHFSEVFTSLESKYLYLILLVLYQIYSFIMSLYIVYKERPDVIFCSGGPASISLSYIGKLFGKKVIYLESLTRVKGISPGAKLIYPISDLFLVQWDSLSRKYEKAKYWGKVI